MWEGDIREVLRAKRTNGEKEHWGVGGGRGGGPLECSRDTGDERL